MLSRKIHLAICVIILAALIGSAGLAFAQVTTGGWSVTPTIPKMTADSPDGWRVYLALGKVDVSYRGISLTGGVSQVAVSVSASRAGMPAYLPAGNYKITLKARNYFPSNVAKLYASTDGAIIPNALTGRLIAQCLLPNGTLTNPVDVECTGTYALPRGSLMNAYFMVDKSSDYLSLTFTKPDVRATQDIIPNIR